MGDIKTARQLLERIEQEAGPSPSDKHMDMLSNELERFLYYAKTNNDYWDVNPDRTPVGGGGLKTFVKRLVRKTTGWYTRPAFDEQRQFNASVTRALNELVIILQSNSRVAELENRLYSLAGESREQSQNIDRIKDKLGLQSPEMERLAEGLYVQFEDAFRGSDEFVRGMLEEYRPYIEEAAIQDEWLDIGCGRGEWLQLMKEWGISARGVDMNADMVAVCRKRGLPAEHADAITALGRLKEASLGGLSAFHVAEHIPFDTLILLLREAMRTVKPGGLILLVTPNPENLAVSSYSFYLDPSHRNPIPPESLIFFVGKLGFVDARVLRMVRRGPRVNTGNADVDALLERLNMEQDYAVLARRP